VEGAGAVAIGALIHKKINVNGKRAVALLSGSSINSEEYIGIIQSRFTNRRQS
jgi:threonine dehydratase